jgi:hypothetical protein
MRPNRIEPPMSVKKGDILNRRLTKVMRIRVTANAMRRFMRACTPDGYKKTLKTCPSSELPIRDRFMPSALLYCDNAEACLGVNPDCGNP